MESPELVTTIGNQLQYKTMFLLDVTAYSLKKLVSMDPTCVAYKCSMSTIVLDKVSFK